MSTQSDGYRSVAEGPPAHEADSTCENQIYKRIEPLLQFLHRHWWKVDCQGFECLPKTGAAVIVGNTSGMIPWVAAMLIYTLVSNKQHGRHINIAIDMDWIKDDKISSALRQLGFVTWSADTVKQLLSEGKLVAIFPEGTAAMSKNISMRNRVTEFDWTRLLPACEMGVKIFPLATLGCDEAAPTFSNFETIAKYLKIRAFPVSPFFPWLPFPLNLATLPVPWKMHLLHEVEYAVDNERGKIEECAKRMAFLTEGKIQCELNRLLRAKHRIL